MKTFTSVNPIDLEELKAITGWVEGPDSDSIVDGHGNQAFVTEIEDGHLQLDVDEDNDISDILDRVSFHREDAEES
ncbi:hypothetical protein RCSIMONEHASTD_45 [Rhodobacter phage RcSimone-Hastad]|jgi:hypothetical protein|nr:hypothetical protein RCSIMONEHASTD_45 [Rhodobacter phage RcSimone-Hastad]